MLVKTKKIRSKVRDDYRVAKVVATVIFGLYSISLLLCIAWAFLMAFKSRAEYLNDPVSFPKIWHIENFWKAFWELTVGDRNMFVMLFNSLWTAGGATFIVITILATTSYSISRYNFFLGKMVYTLCIAVMIIPIGGSLASSFLLAKRLRYYDSPLIFISWCGGIGFPAIMMGAIFKNIDQGYAEAAFIDGASHAQIFFKIMLPLAMPALGALALMGFIGSWNDSEGPLIMLPSYPTIASGLYIYQLEAARLLNYPILYAGLLISSVPSVILWLIFNKNLQALQFGGGIKG